MQISQTQEYITAQTMRVAPFPVMDGSNGQFKIQVISEKGKTNWMNITPEQFRWIEKVLHGIDLKEA